MQEAAPPGTEIIDALVRNCREGQGEDPSRGGTPGAMERHRGDAMMLALVLLYHLILLGGLVLASGSMSGAEILMAIALIGLGSAALVETTLMLEPARAHRRRRTA